MAILAITFAITAALINAASAVMQRKAMGQPSAKHLFTGNILKNVLGSNLWRAGLLLQMPAFILQAAAYYTGALVLVAPILTLDLVFLLLLLHFKTNLTIGLREWIAVGAICAGLSGLLIAAHPQEGSPTTSLANWIGSVGGCFLILVACSFIAPRFPSHKWRAGVLGVASGLSFAMVAVFTKLSSHRLEDGIFALLGSWEVYALIAAGITAFILQQNTYGAGPLASSQPAVEIAGLFASVTLGMALFGDTINTGTWALIGAIIFGGILTAGVFLLSNSPRLYPAKEKEGT